MKIYVDGPSRALSLALAGRWKNFSADLVVVEGIRHLLSLVEKERAQTVLACSLSSVFLFDVGTVLSLPSLKDGRFVKISIHGESPNAYAATKSRLVQVLSSRLAAKRECTVRELFTEVLSPAADVTENVEGRILFHNIADLTARNLLASAEEAPPLPSWNPVLSEMPPESRISEGGNVKNSFLSPGCEIEGDVQNSVIFPNVTVRAKTQIVNSVIMTNNRIGTGTVIQNALVLPFTQEGPRSTTNIGDRCLIGGRSSSAVNLDFPDTINDGLTLVGMNATIPNGFRMEPGSYIGPSVPASALKSRKILRKGTSIT